MRTIKMNASGRVQGVGFRYMTKMVADQIGIGGIVCNQNDGSVYIEAMVPKMRLIYLLKKLKNHLHQAAEWII